MDTWIDTPVRFFKGGQKSRLLSKSSSKWGLLFAILIYEFLLGSVISYFHPLVGLLLAGSPFLLIALIAGPVWAYGLFIVGIQFSNISFTQLGPYNLRVVDIAFFLFLSILVINAFTKKRFIIPKTGIDISLWIFLGWIMLSFTWSMDRNVGLEALIKIFIGVITFYGTVYLISERSRLNMAINMWLLASFISALAAIYEFRTVAFHNIMPFMTKWATPIRSQGFFGGPIMLGSFLTLSIIISYSKILNAKSFSKRILFIAICGIMIIGLLTTLSRNDIAAWILVTLFFMYRFKRMRIPVVTAVLMVLLLGLILTGKELFTVFWHRFFYLFEGLETSSPMRVDVWRLALQTIMENPFLGVGLGGFTAVAIEQLKHGLIYPHSLILYVLVDFGFLGFLFVTYFALCIFWFVRSTERNLVNDFDKAIATAMTGGLLVHVFWSLTQNITFQHIIFWAFLGISFASYHVLIKDTE